MQQEAGVVLVADDHLPHRRRLHEEVRFVEAVTFGEGLDLNIDADRQAVVERRLADDADFELCLLSTVLVGCILRAPPSAGAPVAPTRLFSSDR